MHLVESMQDFKLHALSEEFLCCFGGHGKLEFQHSLSLMPMLVTSCSRLHIISHTPVFCLENEDVDISFILHFSANSVQFYCRKQYRWKCVLFTLFLHLFIPDWCVCLYTVTILSTQQGWTESGKDGCHLLTITCFSAIITHLPHLLFFIHFSEAKHENCDAIHKSRQKTCRDRKETRCAAIPLWVHQSMHLLGKKYFMEMSKKPFFDWQEIILYVWTACKLIQPLTGWNLYMVFSKRCICKC